MLAISPSPKQTSPSSPSYDEQWIGAFFDVDNTIVPGLSIEVLFVRRLWTQGLIGFREFQKSLGYLLRHIPPFSLSPLRTHKLYLVGLLPQTIEPLAEEFISSIICPKISSRAKLVISRHQRAGHHIALISGSPEFLVKPVASCLNVSIVRAARMESTKEGYTGRVFAPLPYGLGKRRWVQQLATKYRLDLNRSYAYGDSPGDLQTLQIVGNPFVVNPIRGMTRIARQYGWPTAQWV